MYVFVGYTARMHPNPFPHTHTPFTHTYTRTYNFCYSLYYKRPPPPPPPQKNPQSSIQLIQSNGFVSDSDYRMATTAQLSGGTIVYDQKSVININAGQNTIIQQVGCIRGVYGVCIRGVYVGAYVGGFESLWVVGGYVVYVGAVYAV